jgi:hypothetical protein
VASSELLTLFIPYKNKTPSTEIYQGDWEIEFVWTESFKKFSLSRSVGVKAYPKANFVAMTFSF